MFKTSEITSYEIPSDNVLNNRLFFAYLEAAKCVKGNLLEVGCGTGKGIEVFAPLCENYTAIDKNTALLTHLSSKYPQYKFIDAFIPPFKDIQSDSMDSLVTLQVIEHIQDDHYFLREIIRVLKTGEKAVIATPNKKMSLTRNPWHVREYTADEMFTLLGKYFTKVELKGVKGSDKVMEYHEQNRRSVQKITRYDIFNLQYRLPRQLLQIPYDILNRLNRNKLMQEDNTLVSSIGLQDFSLSDKPEECLDLFAVVEK
ncbi:class I SAM-dependent methyltransferase [Thermoflexibacter ruber]|uniref:Methyltransferase domain-containing protein n=1 Tax=Thermoflexibacter ruber TaxID=1003 RepID=A0A1I2C9B3_9BACT|nr:class I SAM-dependent methyltransferase [Thermoflexibacter ruber]SFE64785.1 Methyltransferase domain-containing protein [Thermoflexibacter ruber]